MHDHARMGDPVSSDRTVKSIVADKTLAGAIMRAATDMHPVPFDDTDLLFWIEHDTDRRQQRNVIARARGRLESDGLLVRVGMRVRTTGIGRETMHFTLPGASQ
jgi:hypothetical protein